jgi:hypothetical protein
MNQLSVGEWFQANIRMTQMAFREQGVFTVGEIAY